MDRRPVRPCRGHRPGGLRGGDTAVHDDSGSSTGWSWALPSFFPTPKVPDTNPMTAEKAELGRFLFYDRRLSGNGTQACASCHIQSKAFTDGLTTSLAPRGTHIRATPRVWPTWSTTPR